MNLRRMVAAGVVILLLGTGTAAANGVDVLDSMEATVVSLENAIASAQAAGADSKGIRKADRAIDAFEAASDALEINDLRTFRKQYEKGVERLMKAEARLAPTYLADGGAAALASLVRDCLVTARGIVDDETGIGPRSADKADRNLAKGDSKTTREKWDSAAYRYLKGLSALVDVPIPAIGSHRSIRLRAIDGSSMNLAISVVPYSPKQTCGACHDYAQITQGFHFDQGKSVIRDDYSAGTSAPDYVLSDGMFGRW